MHISISGFPPDTTEEELLEPLKGYGATIQSIKIEPSEDDHNYMALIDVDTNETGCKVLADKINGRVWRGRKLRARYFLFEK